MNGITTRQYLEGDKIIAEEILNASGSVAHTKYYIYDQTGIAGMVYDGESYYFGKNIFGDVTTIYDCYGNWEAGYEYDLWGNITSGGSSGIAKENPFRYRGYYYDSETGFYYLQSRYYDPEICRFINADNLELLSTLSGTPGQLNLYAYCNNNPVMYSDPSGEIVITSSVLIGLAITAGIGAAVGAGSYLAVQTISYALTGEWTWSWGMFLGSIIGGALNGALGFIFPKVSPSFIAAICGAASTASGMSLENTFGEANNSGMEILLASVVSAMSSMASTVISDIIVKNFFNQSGSYSRIYKQISTKFRKSLIHRISLKTARKMLVYSAGCEISNVLLGVSYNTRFNLERKYTFYVFSF